MTATLLKCKKVVDFFKQFVIKCCSSCKENLFLATGEREKRKNLIVADNKSKHNISQKSFLHPAENSICTNYYVKITNEIAK